MEIYPLTFNPIYKEMVWGGAKMRSLYGREIPYEKTGESWDVSCREKEMGVVSNGAYKGLSFREVIELAPASFLGEKFRNFTHFPLLVKIIDAADFLSVQVHPDDEYALRRENAPFGKNEMWCVLSAEEGSHLVLGLKDGVSRADFSAMLENGAVEDALEKLPVRAGDVVNIPAGLVHAIGRGITLAEIQQNSDITYRVYDYGRLGLDGKPRELHKEKALDVIDFGGKLPKAAVKPEIIGESAGFRLSRAVKTPHFNVNLLELDSTGGPSAGFGDFDAFQILTVTEGSCVLSAGGCETPLKTADSVFLPAKLGERGGYRVTGVCKALISYC
ncbi:MAG: class I mannose-6-phosphate isomerase [Clostridiales bacterium]|jgi:mannose-6-phosphate isomerase|nr:class I mannose-6-phosphate isomerase [Clostridiales bacterium]